MNSISNDREMQRYIQQCRAIIPDSTDEALEHACRVCRLELGAAPEDRAMLECMVHMLTGEDPKNAGLG